MRPLQLLPLLALAVVPASLSLRATAQTSLPSGSSIPTPATSAASSAAPAALAAPPAFLSASGAAKPSRASERSALEQLPDQPSPMPPMKAWESAPELHLEPFASACSGHLLREWLHVRCGSGAVDVSLLAGDSKDVSLNLVGEDFARDGDIVLPLRRGRSHVVSITSVELGRYSSGLPNTTALLWVSWPEGEASPTIRLE
jgi:hypothetical protein